MKCHRCEKEAPRVVQSYWGDQLCPPCCAEVDAVGAWPEHPVCNPALPTRQEAWAGAERGMAEADANASEAWKAEAYRQIRLLAEGYEFLAEELVPAIEAHGLATHNRKAMGPVIRKASKDGLIVNTGSVRHARTSHLQPKPIWRRTAVGTMTPGGRPERVQSLHGLDT